MKLNRIQYEFKSMNWCYDIKIDKYLCLAGPNGSGKTLILRVARALIESVMTETFNPLINIIREEKIGQFGSKRIAWHYFFDDVRIEYDNGRYAYIQALDPEHGVFRVSINGVESMLPNVPKSEFMSFVPLLDDERHRHYGATIGELLQFNKGELPKKFIEKLCKSFLDKEAYPKYFSPMPEQKDYKKIAKWYDALEDWLDSFSHGEKEMMCLAMGLKAAKASSEILFIDNFGDGIHITSQEVIARAIPSMADDIEIIYTTHHPCMIPGDHSHYADLWDLQEKERQC